MGLHTIPNSEVRYGLMAFDGNGHEREESAGKFSETLLREAAAEPVTNVFLFSHGWMGDIPAAVDQYDRWIGALMKSADVARAKEVFPGFQPLLIGLHWPSLPWGEEEAREDGSFAAGGGPGDLLAEYVERFGDRPEIRGPLEIIFGEARRNMTPDNLPEHVRKAYLELNEALGLGSDGVSAPPDADREEFDPEEAFQAGNEDGANFAEFSLGGLLGPLRQLSYWSMKKRARTVGSVLVGTRANLRAKSRPSSS